MQTKKSPIFIIALFLLANATGLYSNQNDSPKEIGIEITPFDISMPYCEGAEFELEFTTGSEFAPGNIFTLQLSNGKGDFSNPALTMQMQAQAGGVFHLTLPMLEISGNRFKFRILSSSPEEISENNALFFIIADMRNVTPLRPEAGAADINTRPVFEWIANEYAEFYQVQVSESEDFSELYLDTLISGSKEKFQGEGFKSGYSFYWRVRAVYSCGPNEWGPARVFHTLYAKPISPPSKMKAGQAVKISYVARGDFGQGNKFYLELISHNNSVNQITAVSSDTGYSVFNAVIPAGAPEGSDYRFRIRSTEPEYTGPDNGYDISIEGLLFVKVDTVESPDCAGGEIRVAFSAGGEFGGNNLFICELSSPTGSFSTPLNLGELPGESGGEIVGQLPADLPGSEKYKIRIRATEGGIISVYDELLSIQGIPGMKIYGPKRAPVNTRQIYIAPEEPGVSINWEVSGGGISGRPDTSAITVNWHDAPDAGIYLSRVDSATGCSGKIFTPVDVFKEIKAEGIVRGDESKGLAGIVVEFKGLRGEFTTFTGQGGDFSIALPDDDIYRAKASSPFRGIFIDRYYPGTGNILEAWQFRPSVISGGLEFIMKRKAANPNSISGSLTGLEGNIAYAVLISHKEYSEPDYIFESRTYKIENINGAFRFDSLKAGPYSLLLYSDDRFFAPFYFGGGINYKGAEIVYAGAEGDIDLGLIDVKTFIPPQDSQDEFKGAAYDAITDKKIQGAVAAILDANGKIIEWGICQDGSYLLYAGQDAHKIICAKHGYVSGEELIPHTSGPKTFDFSLKRDYSTKAISIENAFEFGLYPNPAVDILEIKGLGTPVKTLYLADLSGNYYSPEYSLSENRLVIETSELSPGAYLLVIETEGDTYYSNFIKTD